MKAGLATDTVNREGTLQGHIAAQDMITVRRDGQWFVIQTDGISSGRLQCLKKECDLPEILLSVKNEELLLISVKTSVHSHGNIISNQLLKHQLKTLCYKLK